MKQPQQEKVTYVRVREIFHPYIKYTYGNLPVDLPESTQLYSILSTGLAPNYSMKKICYSTFSAAAYEYNETDTNNILYSSQKKIYIPSEEDKEKLIPFVMPHSFIYGGRIMPTDKWCQITPSAYKEFRAQLEREFWHAFVNFDMKVALHCDRNGLKYTQEVAIEKFMVKIGMNLDDLETMARYWRNEKKKYETAISPYNKKESSASIRAQIEYDIINEIYR